MANPKDTDGQIDLALVAGGVERTVDVADVESIVRALQGKGWVTAETLAGVLGEGWTDRKVRAVARASAPGVVSFPGSKGYKLWTECSVAEIDQAISAFESQAKDMTQRAWIYRKEYHALGRGNRP